jgi:hypothetical protein
MRLLTLHNLISLLAITQIATAFALLRPENSTSTSAETYSVVEKRENTQLTVPIVLTALETWQGTTPYLGIFGTGLRNGEIRTSAEQTYKSLTGRLPSTLLVSVIFVPGAGLAAGTILRDGNHYFEGPAMANAPMFWAAVPGNQQALLPGSLNENKWHAEAVAVRLAEMTFGTRMVNGKWPAGTKIATFRKVSSGNGGPKASCSEGHTSVTRPYKNWLVALNIERL